MYAATASESTPAAPNQKPNLNRRPSMATQIITEKQCSKCKEFKPRISFRKVKRGDGLYSYCRRCESAYRRGYYHKGRSDNETHQYEQCHLVKPKYSFPPSKVANSGVIDFCTACLLIIR